MEAQALLDRLQNEIEACSASPFIKSFDGESIPEHKLSPH